MNIRYLAVKLITEGHLNVDEREHLPSDGIAFSEIEYAALEIFKTEKFLPPSWANEFEFEGAKLENTPDGYDLHECHEDGVGRYGPIKTKHYEKLSNALHSWLRVQYGDSIDGIPVDWES